MMNDDNVSPRIVQAVIDIHTHLGRWLAPDADWMASDLAGRCDAPWMTPDVGTLLALMDEHGVEACVNLDGRWGPELEANLDRYDRAHPGRFVTFCQLPWTLAAEGDGFADALVESLHRCADAGARGLKVWKTLGLGYRDARGELLLPDDERAAPVFAAAGELGLPVLIHVADPVEFFSPVEQAVHWRAELLEHPEWSFAGPPFPSHARLMEALEALVARHPETTFVAAHVASHVEDLGRVSRMLAAHPNLHVDGSARLRELAEQPEATRRLILDHPDRVVFGTDELPPSADGYRRWYEFLDGLGLPDAALRAVYADNARRILKRRS